MAYVEVLLPTIVVALIFWFVMRAVFRVDRNERRAEAEADAQREAMQKAAENHEKENPSAN
ncbi:hypothetical protein [Arthrobacter sp.]|uniref:hypothetical protein n=1 Tax=Arthrobacter sp. TaxID=1667 RepID=UPI003A8DA291